MKQSTKHTADDKLPVAKQLKPEAIRALAEAHARRSAAVPAALAPEIAGRDGPEPVRYGDWEVKGIASDF